MLCGEATSIYHMYTSILVPTDGSAYSSAAAGHAIDLAQQYDATLHILYVVDTAAYASLDAGSQQVISALKTEGKEATERIEAAATEAGITATTQISMGAPHKQIVGYAKDNGIDLIVMGTQGRTGLNRYLLGSVTERVVRLAHCPVLTVKNDDAE